MNIHFEHPFNERIRSYLRLEYLFDRFFCSVLSNDDRLTESAIFFLINILETSDRFDIKSLILQDLGKYSTILSRLRGHPEVFQDKLEIALVNVDQAFSKLNEIRGKISHTLEDINWLNTIRKRLSSFGYIAEVDMPSYYFWKKKSRKDRLENLSTWINPFKPLYQGLKTTLELLRESGKYENVQTSNGGYSKSLDGKTFQLMKVLIDQKHNIYPEIIVNRHVIWIQFLDSNGQKYLGRDINFQIAYFNGYESKFS